MMLIDEKVILPTTFQQSSQNSTHREHLAKLLTSSIYIPFLNKKELNYVGNDLAIINLFLYLSLTWSYNL